MEKEYILIQDRDCHWYVVPEQMELDFNAWADREEDDDEDVPSYAERVNGSPSLVKFTKYRID